MIVSLNPSALTADAILEGVNAVPVSALPPIWQKIAAGTAQIGHPEPEFLIALARLFYTKATDGSSEIFSDRGNSWFEKIFCFFERFFLSRRYCKLATETLNFFGNDFLKSTYPSFENLHSTAKATDGAENVIAFVQQLFEEFGYEMPASFYWVLLSPINRGSIYESCPIFFAPEMQGLKRSYDAMLHALNVTEILMIVQTYATPFGFRIVHGCGCNQEHARLSANDQPITCVFSGELGRRKALNAYLWRAMNEYMFFPLGVHAETLAL